jgi:hypothetical protein
MSALTDKFVASLKAGTGRLEIRDDGCRGLSIRVTSGRKGGGVGKKTWCYRFKRAGRMHRLTLGEAARRRRSFATAPHAVGSTV